MYIFIHPLCSLIPLKCHIIFSSPLARTEAQSSAAHQISHVTCHCPPKHGKLWVSHPPRNNLLKNAFYCLHEKALKVFFKYDFSFFHFTEERLLK